MPLFIGKSFQSSQIIMILKYSPSLQYLSIDAALGCNMNPRSLQQVATLISLYSLFLLFFFLLLGDAFDYLDGPIFRVTGADIPMPYAHLLETHSVPQVENIVLTVKKSLNLA